MDIWILIPLVAAVLIAFLVRYAKSLERRDNLRALMGQRYEDERATDNANTDEFDVGSRSAEQELMSRLAARKIA